MNESLFSHSMVLLSVPFFSYINFLLFKNNVFMVELSLFFILNPAAEGAKKKINLKSSHTCPKHRTRAKNVYQ